MSLDIKLICDEITEISPTGSRYDGPLSVELSGVKLTDAVEIETIISEYGQSDILDAIDIDDVIAYVIRQGYSVEEE